MVRRVTAALVALMLIAEIHALTVVRERTQAQLPHVTTLAGTARTLGPCSEDLRKIEAVTVPADLPERHPLQPTPVLTVSVTESATPSAASGTITLKATAYCSCASCCGKSNGRTATGAQAAWGTIAADWGRFPPGTQMRIAELPGTVFTVQDRGGAIHGNKIDIWFPTHAEALQWGLRTIHVEVL